LLDYVARYKFIYVCMYVCTVFRQSLAMVLTNKLKQARLQETSSPAVAEKADRTAYDALIN